MGCLQPKGYISLSACTPAILYKNPQRGIAGISTAKMALQKAPCDRAACSHGFTSVLGLMHSTTAQHGAFTAKAYSMDERLQQTPATALRRALCARKSQTLRTQFHRAGRPLPRARLETAAGETPPPVKCGSPCHEQIAYQPANATATASQVPRLLSIHLAPRTAARRARPILIPPPHPAGIVPPASSRSARPPHARAWRGLRAWGRRVSRALVSVDKAERSGRSPPAPVPPFQRATPPAETTHRQKPGCCAPCVRAIDPLGTVAKRNKL